MPPTERLIVIVLFDQVDLLDVTGPPEVFALLQREMSTSTGHRVLLAANSLAPVTTSAGVRVLPDATFDSLHQRAIDTLVVPGAVTVDEAGRVQALVDPVVVDEVRGLAEQSRRVASVCVGAHILAAAGLLQGCCRASRPPRTGPPQRSWRMHTTMFRWMRTASTSSKATSGRVPV